MLDVVTIDGRVSGHLLVSSVERRPAGELPLQHLLPGFCQAFLARHPLRPLLQSLTRRPSLATLAGLFALKHYWLDASAGGTNSGLFTRLLSLSLSVSLPEIALEHVALIST